MKKNINFIVTILIAAALFAVLFKKFPDALSSDQSKLSLAFALVIAVSLLSKIINSEMRLGIILKQISGWMIISLIILTGYSYQYELKQFGDRLAATLIPGVAQSNNDGSITFYAGENGHFSITAILNNKTNVNFLFDTGASLVSLTASDASNLGIDINNLKYNFPLSTANGTSYGARVNIDTIQIGSIVIENVEAVVSKDGSSDVSLLGMSFLSKLKQFSIKGNSLNLIN